MLKLQSKKSARHISSFFIEIILVLLFFSIACAILVQVFAKAYNQNREADRLNRAVMSATAFCELYSDTADIDNASEKVFNASPDGNGNITIPCNNKNNGKNPDRVMITEHTDDSETGTLSTATIKLFYKDKTLCEMHSSCYIKKEVRHE